MVYKYNVGKRCMRKKEAESFMYTESTALLTALDWTGSDGTGTPSEEVGIGGWDG